MLLADAQGSEPKTRQWTYLTRAGGRVPVSLTMSPVDGSQGEAIGFIGIASDDGETRAALAALNSEREVYRMLVEHLPAMAVGLLDEDLRWQTVGGEYHGRKEYRTREGRLVGDSLASEEAEAIRAFYRQGLERHVSVEMERQPGDWFEIDALPMKGPDGPPRILTLARDVSARHSASRSISSCW